MRYIAVFKNTRDVIRTDRICREQGIDVQVMPVPEKISSECGMCLKFEDNLYNQFIEITDKNNITTKIYEQQ